MRTAGSENERCDDPKAPPPKKGSYEAQDIQVLEGLEPVRKRPGMYIGGTGKDGLHHLVWEIVDNAVDEAINGYASRIGVVLKNDNRTVEVTDNGRGIPSATIPSSRSPRSRSSSPRSTRAESSIRRTTSRPAASTASARASSTRLSERLTATVRPRRQGIPDGFRRGKTSKGGSSRREERARHGHRRSSSHPTWRSSATSSSTPTGSRSGSTSTRS
jgi:hypothetical protein